MLLDLSRAIVGSSSLAPLPDPQQRLQIPLPPLTPLHHFSSGLLFFSPLIPPTKAPSHHRFFTASPTSLSFPLRLLSLTTLVLFHYFLILSSSSFYIPLSFLPSTFFFLLILLSMPPSPPLPLSIPANWTTLVNTVHHTF